MRLCVVAATAVFVLASRAAADTPIICGHGASSGCVPMSRGELFGAICALRLPVSC